MNNLALPCLFLLLALVFCTLPALAQTPDTAAIKVEIAASVKDAQTKIGQGKLDEAQRINEQAMQQAVQHFGKTSIPYSSTQLNQGRIWHRKEKWAEAKVCYLEAKQIIAQRAGTAHPDYAKALNNLAVLCAEMSDYDEAKSYHQEVIALRKKTPGEQSPEYALSLQNYANFCYGQAKYDTAEVCYKTALSIRKHKPGAGSVEYSHSLSGLATLYLQTGQLPQAEPLYRDAIRLQPSTNAQDSINWAGKLSNLAVLLYQMGRYEEADSLNTHSLSIFRTLYGLLHKECALRLNNRGNIRHGQKRYEEAAKYHQEALTVQEKVHSATHPEIAQSYNNLAADYTALGRLDEASELLAKAITLDCNAPPLELECARDRDNLGVLYQNMGRFAEAEGHMKAAKETRKRVLGKEHFLYASSLLNLAKLYNQVGDLRQLDTLLAEYNLVCYALLRKASTYLTERELSDYEAVFAHFIFTNYDLAHDHWAERKSLVSIAYDNTLFYKGFLLQTAARLRRQSVGEAATARRVVCWQDVQAKLKADEVAVEFVHYEYQGVDTSLKNKILYAALILSPGQKPPRFVHLFEQRVLAQLMEPGTGASEESIVKNLYGGRQDFYQLLWVPLAPFLGNARSIYYAPSGLLHRINPAALMDPMGQVLASKHNWVRLQSTRALAVQRLADQSFAKAPRMPHEQTAVIFGDISYDMDSTAYLKANATHLGKAAQDFSVRPLLSSDMKKAAHVPNSAFYTDSIARNLLRSGFKTQIYRGFEASEETMKAMGSGLTPSPRIVQITTHGYADMPKVPDEQGDLWPKPLFAQNPMLRSGLLLAGCNHFLEKKRPLSNGEDAVLLAYEAQQLNLQNTELAVLTACSTNLGDDQAIEGAYSMQRALSIAGAKFQIVSLWEVPAQDAQSMIASFYGKWLAQKLSLREAFTAAQDEMRKKPNPYIWAAWVLVE